MDGEESPQEIMKEEHQAIEVCKVLARVWQ